MSTHFIFPKPRDWETLEDIVCDVFSRKYESYNFQRYGRRGQKQKGVDIVGPVDSGLLGIQCKHHPKGNIPEKEIDDEITNSEEFTPKLNAFVIATSADRDVNSTDYVSSVSKDRVKRGEYPVEIKFWEDIYGWLTEYPDLVYKHFTKYFPRQELETLNIPGLDKRNKNTLLWPITGDELKVGLTDALSKIEKVDPYKLSIGFTTFPAISFSRIVDLEIQFSSLFDKEIQPEEIFKEGAGVLNQVLATISDTYFSKELLVHLQSRLTFAFLFGWKFRRVSHFTLKLVHGKQIWATDGLPFVQSKLLDIPPELINNNSNEIVFILNLSREISASVFEFVKNWTDQPKAVLGLTLSEHRINSAAHALSLALEISQKIKTFIDVWRVRKIHLFGALPAALATLIGYNLNAICPITIYFLDETRTQYKPGGTILNNL